jgi:tyrosyl-tRNA synthetase
MPETTEAADHRSASAQAAAAAERLARNAVDSLPAGALADKLSQAAAEGRPLRVKLGIDPTAPDIHLGHAVVLRKLREFQDAGHRVVLIIGDYTARVGDPSGRSSERPILSPEQIEANARTFHEQATKILDDDDERLEIRRNSEWLDMPLAELFALLRTATAAQLLERDDFAQRWSANEPISLLELLYPLLQAYDSVAVRADVELGGTDQKFNLLLGRDIQRVYGQASQAILTMPLLVGIDGKRKMSKSLGNHIAITDEPTEMYGRTLRIPDEAIAEYARLLLPAGVGSDTAAAADAAGGAGGDEATRADGVARGVSARDAKRALARGVISWLHSPQAAQAAEQHFDRVHIEHEAPEEVADAAVEAANGVVHLPGVISTEFGVSRSQARSLIDEGGVTLGDDPVIRGEYDVPLERAEGALLKVGKRRFRRLKPT